MNANRRTFLQTVGIGGALAQYRPVHAATGTPVAPNRSVSTNYLEPARQVAAWIRASALKQSTGIAWPYEPDKPDTVGPDIYKGNAGTLIFFLELARATNDSSYSDDALRAADFVIDRAAGIEGSGFSRDLAGAAWSILETWKATGETRYRGAAISITDALVSRAHSAGAGVTWGPAFDVSGGDAGIVSYLLYAARTFDRDDWRQVARNAGKHLIEIAAKNPEGNLLWPGGLAAGITIPNFAHGTAGVATVLAQLYSQTHDQEFLDAALSGAAHLKSIARADRDTFLIHHHEPTGLDLFYLGQCNGPAGSARLFYELHRNTKDRDWLDITEGAAGAILKSGIPEQRRDAYPQIPLRVEYSVKPGHLPGFWNNISQCCGAAGIADFFLGLYQATGNDQYLDFARRALDNVVNRAFIDDKGYRWYQSEFRVQPWIVVAQTGYMQGAAGVGSALLHLRTALDGKYHAVLFPYDPFPHGALRENA